jgi:hypothetical protein
MKRKLMLPPNELKLHNMRIKANKIMQEGSEQINKEYAGSNKRQFEEEGILMKKVADVLNGKISMLEFKL